MIIYVIICENKKYYVGSTKNMKKRFLEHVHGRGAKFTQMHKPIRYNILEHCDKFVHKKEHEWTVKYVLEHGFRNVRGGNWLSMRDDCYTARTLHYLLWSIKDQIAQGLLGVVDPPLLSQ